MRVYVCVSLCIERDTHTHTNTHTHEHLRFNSGDSDLICLSVSISTSFPSDCSMHLKLRMTDECFNRVLHDLKEVSNIFKTENTQILFF